MSKKHSGRSSLRDFGSDSFPPAGHSRKDLQLCRQVADTLQLALGDCGDDVLRDLHVVRVVPAPDASQLLVIVGSAPGAHPPPPTPAMSGTTQCYRSWQAVAVDDAMLLEGAEDAAYELSAVTLHSGSRFGGHYKAVVRAPGGGGWLECDDSSVAPCPGFPQLMETGTWGSFTVTTALYSKRAPAAAHTR